ncbi:MAG: hypothetical protein GF414_04415 [Candidatus Altiarchaeales archaeon]|nr:hypothetical protein [Candidatus Altiarchaeales archaeon]
MAIQQLYPGGQEAFVRDGCGIASTACPGDEDLLWLYLSEETNQTREFEKALRTVVEGLNKFSPMKLEARYKPAFTGAEYDLLARMAEALKEMDGKSIITAGMPSPAIVPVAAKLHTADSDEGQLINKLLRKVEGLDRLALFFKDRTLIVEGIDTASIHAVLAEERDVLDIIKDL